MKKKSNRTIVITGATGDIAQEIVKRLPDDHLILASRSLSALTERYGQRENTTLLTNEELLADQFDGTVDILINNAGMGIFEPLSALTEADIRTQFEVNAIFPIELAQKLQPQVQLINIASIAGKLPTAKSTIYAASKAALLAFSDALRMENPELIVTTVNTGPVKTKFHADNQDYLEKVGKNAITAGFVADKIVRNLGKKKREINLPWQLALVAKLRAVSPSLIDFFSVHFFNYK